MAPKARSREETKEEEEEYGPLETMSGSDLPLPTSFHFSTSYPAINPPVD